jgi:putative tricarboxylic transport membrane protein
MGQLNADVAFGLLFAALGVALLGHSAGFPPGTPGVPGPGFFPMLVGALLCLLGLGLAAGSRRNGAAIQYWDKPWGDPAIVRIVTVIALLALYILVWERVGFIWRTPPLLFLLYLVLGVHWIRSLILAVAVTGVLAGVFQGLFSLRL